jgi:hypothetical protein
VPFPGVPGKMLHAVAALVVGAFAHAFEYDNLRNRVPVHAAPPRRSRRRVR